MPLVKWVWGWKKESNFMWSTYLRVILRILIFLQHNVLVWRRQWSAQTLILIFMHGGTWHTYDLIENESRTLQNRFIGFFLLQLGLLLELYLIDVYLFLFCLFCFSYANQNPKTCLFHASGIKKRENTVISIQKTFFVVLYM